MAFPPPIRVVLLDVDGTLVDSNDAHALAWVEAFSTHGIDVPFSEIRRRIGMGGDKLMPEVAGLTDESPIGQAISATRSHLFQTKYLPQLHPFPGARELLRRMKTGGLTLVAASSAKEDELGGLLRLVEAESLLDARTSADDAERSKPDPDIIRSALRRAGASPSEALLLGDTPYDIEAAAHLGVRTIAFRCGGWDDRSLAAALAIYDGPADLLARYEESPLAHRYIGQASASAKASADTP